MTTPLPTPLPSATAPLPAASLAPASAPRMRAVVQASYGSPDVLAVAEVGRPSVADDDVLVRVVVAGITKGDWHLLTGTPYLVRLVYGFSGPKKPIPGMAIAGRVEAVGRNVTTFAVGDEVFGEINRGAFAEYVCVKEVEVARKPAGVSFEDAATVPVSATTAIQGVRDAGGIKAGQSILINGAAGGVGTFAVQLARWLGAEVTGVCSAGNAALVRSLGAKHVVDYGKEDFTRGEKRYDVILDLVGNHPLAAMRRVLTAKGRLVAAAGGGENRWVGPMLDTLGGMLSNVVSGQPFVPLLNKPNAADLALLGGLLEAGTLKAVVDRRYTLDEVPEGMRYLGLGRTRGKSVVTL